MKLVKYDPQTNVAVFSYHTEDEIALLPTTTMRGGGIGPVSEGSKAINDISANNVYSLTSDGVWVKYETGGGGGGNPHAITYDKMNLTLAQQKQVRENIAAPSYADIIQPKKIDDYLYEVEFTDLDWEYGKDFEKNKRTTSLGACSSARSGNWFGRNYDWNYDETDYYIIRVNKSKTVKHWSIGMTGFPDITPDTYRALPFITLDGINDCGVFANINILPSDAMGTTTGTTPLVSKEDELGAVMLPRFILDNFATAEEAVEYIQDYISVYCKENEELHLMIGDATSTYLMEFIENAIVVTEMDERPYMTNFYLEGTEVDSDGHIDYDTVTDYGFGLERYDMLADGIAGANSLEGMTELMNSINWTNAYSTEMDPVWKTEFVTPELGLTIHSSLEDFAEVLTYERALFANRTRDGQTWQTCHTTVYDIQNKVMYLQTQEDAEQIKVEYRASGGGSAASTSYDNTNSGLAAENVQDAIDEVYENSKNTVKVINEDSCMVSVIEEDTQDIALPFLLNTFSTKDKGICYNSTLPTLCTVRQLLENNLDNIGLLTPDMWHTVGTLLANPNQGYIIPASNDSVGATLKDFKNLKNNAILGATSYHYDDEKTFPLTSDKEQYFNSDILYRSHRQEYSEYKEFRLFINAKVNNEDHDAILFIIVAVIDNLSPKELLCDNNYGYGVVILDDSLDDYPEDSLLDSKYDDMRIFTKDFPSEMEVGVFSFKEPNIIAISQDIMADSVLVTEGNAVTTVQDEIVNLKNDKITNPTAPTTDGSYQLTCDVVDGVVTYSWKPIITAGTTDMDEGDSLAAGTFYAVYE